MNNNQIITVTVSYFVKKDKITEFELWLKKIISEATKFEGHLGTNIIKPTETTKEYIVIFKFDKYKNLRKWLASDIRNNLMFQLKPFINKSPEFKQTEGLEFWFTLPNGNIKPPKHKMVIVTWFGLFPVVLINSYLFKYLFTGIVPSIIVSGLATFFTVFFMTYFIMPFITKVFSFWLFKKK